MSQEVSSSASSQELHRPVAIDARMIALMRCVLAFAGLAFIYLDPTQTRNMTAPTYGALVGYGMWATILLYWTTRSRQPEPPRFAHWGDVLFSAYLVTLTQGINSVFFSFFLFSILVASFVRGFREGLWVAVTSVVLFVLVGLVFSPDAVFMLDRSLIQPIYLLTLGYMIAYWGGLEVEQRRRLKLLHDINEQWNPRLGYDHALGTHLESALSFFGAASCVLVQKRATDPPLWLSYHAARGRPGQATIPRPIDHAAGRTMLGLPDWYVALHEESPSWMRRILPLFRRLVPGREDLESLSRECSILCNLLDSTAFMSAPFAQRDGTRGRVFLTPGKFRFTASDASFAMQLVTAISRVVEGVQLTDELVSRAADHERFRISLDIHDTTIQPYVGLKLGLDALHRKTTTDNPLHVEISELRDMAESTINDLRKYTATLRQDAPLAGEALIRAIRLQADQFERFYRIGVTVQHDPNLLLSARLGNVVLHIVAEGLSNVLRHTEAKTARISLRRTESSLLLEIANESNSASPASFVPASISSRAQSLGGSIDVSRDEQGYTLVRVQIPL